MFARVNDIALTGVTFKGRQNNLWMLRNAQKGYLTLRREPSNPYDPNAIQVLAHCKATDGTENVVLVGYMPKNKAYWLAPLMDEKNIVRVPNDFKFIGGYNHKSLGLRFSVVYEYNAEEEMPS